MIFTGSEITILRSKQAPRHFRTVLSCSKKHFISCLLDANVFLPIVEQIHTGYEALTVRAAYKNAYRFMHYISRNGSVRPHQVNHCVKTLMPC